MTIDLYSWATPNGHKVHIMLEELGLDYNVHPVNIGAGDQFDPEFLRISPNNKMPSIVDRDGPGGEPLAIFESGAILLYLAEKHGQFLSSDPRERSVAVQWLMWQMGGLGPMLGQAHHFLQYAPEKIEYAVNRYSNEANRLYGVLDRRLGESRFLGGASYGIADMAAWPWTRFPERQGVDKSEFPNFLRWFAEIEERPAVQRGIQVLTNLRTEGFDDKAREILFGATQYARR